MSGPFEPVTSDDPPAEAPMSAFLPLLILVLVMLAWFVFQAVQLRTERDAMREVLANQEKPMGDSKKLRDSLEGLTRGTAKLADGGNANARLVIDELKRRGISITPDATAPTK